MIELFHPYIPPEAPEEVTRVLHSRWIGQGPKVDLFEKEFEKFFNVKYAVALNSGTSALETAYDLLELKKNDEVITSPLTCSATTLPLLARKVKIVWADILEDTLCIDPIDVRSKITSKTKAIVQIHLGGIKADVGKIHVDKFQVPVISDAAQALGIFNGDISCNSFQAIKHISCFPKGTRIIKKPGPGKGGIGSNPIEKISLGDEILTYNISNGTKEYKKVIKLFEKEYSGNLCFFKFSNNNELKITGEHPVYVVDKGWVRAKDLLIGDKVVQYNYQGVYFRLFGINSRGKSVEKIFGKKIGKKIRKMHSIRMSGKAHPLWNKHHSADTRRKIGMKNSQKIFSKQLKNRLRIIHKKRWKIFKSKKNEYRIWLKKTVDSTHSPEAQKKRSATLLNFYAIPKNRKRACERIRKIAKSSRTPEALKKKSKSLLKFYSKPENRKKAKERVRKTMQTPHYWIKYHLGIKRSPNNSEKKLIVILNEACPREFRYNGDFSAGVTLAGLVPDFVNVNGKKKVVELFGTFWHSKKVSGKYFFQQKKEKEKRYGSVGWDCLIVKEKELKNTEDLKKRILNYVYNPNCEVVQVTSINSEPYSGKVFNIETEDNHNYFAYGILVHNCGDGGMITLNNSGEYHKAKLMRWFGIDREKKIKNSWQCYKERRMTFDIEILGYKRQMTDVAATLGLCGLRHYNEVIAHRKKLFDIYKSRLSKIDGIKIIDGKVNTFWLCTLLVEHRDEFARMLFEAGIDSNLVQLRNDLYSIFGSKRQNLPVLNSIEDKYISIPQGMHVSSEDISYICDTIERGWA
jgi:dTDP-4-amino-4,6-dideoxygalactose transaminase/intein/homing endonuclease